MYYICSRNLKLSMNRITDDIEKMAAEKDIVTFSELTVGKSEVYKSSARNALSRMVKEGRIGRTGRGVYRRAEDKSRFQVAVGRQEKAVARKISKAMPLVTFCIYNGQTFAPLQHHLSANNVTYVETEADAVESVFHLLKGLGYEAYQSPSAEFVQNYIDLSKRVVVVKRLVTEAPVERHDGVNVPTLEKVLVDIRKDPDFYYLQGTEAEYMTENARSLYSVNDSRLRRYATRRNVVVGCTEVRS